MPSILAVQPQTPYRNHHSPASRCPVALCRPNSSSSQRSSSIGSYSARHGPRGSGSSSRRCSRRRSGSSSRTTAEFHCHPLPMAIRAEARLLGVCCSGSRGMGTRPSLQRQQRRARGSSRQRRRRRQAQLPCLPQQVSTGLEADRPFACAGNHGRCTALLHGSEASGLDAHLAAHSAVDDMELPV